MDSPKSSTSQQTSLDSLRTVEFRQTLRGYHIDDVDEYLERVAIEAEAMQEQMRQSGDRMRQATERIAQLEQSLEHMEQQLAQAQAQAQVAPAPAAAVAAAPDDALQRTLLLAQKFVDQTEAEAAAQARATLAEAETRAQSVIAEAENRARTVTEETERRLREDIARLESMRTQLAGDVETMAQHLETERNRLRAALGEMLSWVDEHVQPTASLLAQPTPAAAPGNGGVPGPTTHDGRPVPTPSPRPTGQTPPVGPTASSMGREAETAAGERQGMMPLSDPAGARAGVTP